MGPLGADLKATGEGSGQYEQQKEYWYRTKQARGSIHHGHRQSAVSKVRKMAQGFWLREVKEKVAAKHHQKPLDRNARVERSD
jgi:hypothetical protein